LIHHIDPSPANLQGDISREKQPILTIDPGDTIIAATRNCDWMWEVPPSPGVYPRSLKREDRKDPQHDVGNCLTGPVAIRGAMPGQTLEVSIDNMRVADYGVSMRGGSHKERYDKLSLPDDFAWLHWSLDHDTGIATNKFGHRIKMRPFLGSIGLAPDLPGYHTNMAPYPTGGNMDCKELVTGSKLYLPVQVADALLSFGDGHAVQGDGEAGGSSIECPMEDVTLTFHLLDDMPMAWPAAKTPDAWITFGFGKTVDDAMFIALSGMLDLLTAKLGISRIEASMMSSLIIDLRVTQLVNPMVGVHAVWPDNALL